MKSRPFSIMFPLVIVILTMINHAYGQDAYEPEPSIIEAEMLRIDSDKFLASSGDDLRVDPKPKINPKAIKDSVITNLPAVGQSNKVKIEKHTPAPKPTVQK